MPFASARVPSSSRMSSSARTSSRISARTLRGSGTSTSGSTDRSAPEEERNFVEKCSANRASGSPWYLVDAEWLKQWCLYTQLKGPRPGPINNHKLLDMTSLTCPKPKSNLKAARDYRGLCFEAWQYLEGIYGGGPRISGGYVDIYSPSIRIDSSPIRSSSYSDSCDSSASMSCTQGSLQLGSERSCSGERTRASSPSTTASISTGLGGWTSSMMGAMSMFRKKKVARKSSKSRSPDRSSAVQNWASKGKASTGRCGLEWPEVHQVMAQAYLVDCNRRNHGGMMQSSCSDTSERGSVASMQCSAVKFQEPEDGSLSAPSSKRTIIV
mmetsp:Transcript_64572/g.154278  ORF Transcript_64572/g.154278 Transcript_64572/m.154278 type:complete len:326 (+) Transcript_64572:63-1040(+)